MKTNIASLPIAITEILPVTAKVVMYTTQSKSAPNQEGTNAVKDNDVDEEKASQPERVYPFL